MTDQGQRIYTLPLSELPLGIRVEAASAAPSAMMSGFVIWKAGAAAGIVVPLELAPVPGEKALAATLNSVKIAKKDILVFHIQANFGPAPVDKRYAVTFQPKGAAPIADAIITVTAPIQTPTYIVKVT